MSQAIIRLLAMLLRLAIVVSSGWGLAILTGITAGRFSGSQLVFYTIQSNILVFACYSIVILRTLWRWIAQRRIGPAHDFPPLVMGAIMLAIVVTGLVYNFILAPGAPDVSVFGIDPLGNALVHSVAPTLVFVDWLLFVEKRSLRWWAPLTWTAIPLAYFVFALIRARVGGPIVRDSLYPYFFIDIDAYGWARVLLNVVGLVVVFVVLAYVAIGIGRLLDTAVTRVGSQRQLANRG